MPTQTQSRSEASRTTIRGRPASQGRAGRSHGGATALSDCIEACNETLAYCLEQGGDHAQKEHILGLIDCIDTCWYLSGLQARDSDLVGQALEICAEATRACQESCEGFGDDATLERCAEACREAAEYCSK